MSHISKCFVCQKPAVQKCGGCHIVFYCNREHQKTDWKYHKKTCQPFSVSEDDRLGRHLIATRAIRTGEVILREPPLIWGPAQYTIPVCLGCGKGLVNERESKPCLKCGWPMCSEICQNAPSHLPECSYTIDRGEKVAINTFNVPHPTYQCLIILRCLYHKQFLPNVWTKLDVLESHCDERKNTLRYEKDKVAVVKFLQRFFKLEFFSEEEILRVCGIVMVNGHEVPLSDPPYIAIYSKTSMFEHSCRSNCCKSFTSSGGILITASTNIERGEHLSICYTDPLWSTTARRQHLYESKFFWCSCERCTDITEIGTYFSCVRCINTSCKGFLTPNTFDENHTEQSEIPWTCNICKCTVFPGEIYKIQEDAGQQLQEMRKGSSSACKVYLNRFEKILTPNNHYLTDVRIALAQMIGQEYGNGLMTVSEDDLMLKARLCKQLENLVSSLVPAERRLRGALLFELHAAVAEIGRRNTIAGNSESLHASLLESKDILQRSIDLLNHEPEELPEGKLCYQAKINLEDIDVILRTVHQSSGDTIM